MTRERHLALGDQEWAIRQAAEQLYLVVDGKPSVRKFISADHASVQYDKLLAERLAAGWTDAAPGTRRKGRAAARTDLEPREPALEAAVLANRDDRAARAVYADWYEARDHPRGALATMQLDERERYGAETKAERVYRHLMRYKLELLGPLDRYVLPPDGESPFEWFGGFIHAVTLVPHDLGSPQQVLRDVLGHPSGRLLAKVTAIATQKRHVSGVLGALRKHPLLDLEIITDKELRDELARLTSLTTLRRFALRVVECADDPRPYAITTGTEVLRAICEVPSSVEHLELTLDGYVRGPSELAPLFARTDLKLRGFAFHAPEALAELLEPLLRAAWAPILEVLDLAHTSAEPLWARLLEHPERFPALREVRVTSSYVLARQLEALRARYRVIDVRDYEHAALFEESVGEEYFYRPIRE